MKYVLTGKMKLAVEEDVIITKCNKQEIVNINTKKYVTKNDVQAMNYVKK